MVSGHFLLLSIAGGVALLLWGTRMVRTGVMRAFGADLRRVLGRATRGPGTAALLGVGMASLLQSSTATALLLVSFAARGLIPVAAGLAVMLGADLGSTLVVQVLSFDVSWAFPALILIGVVLFLSTSVPFRRHIGRVFIGLGLLLLALRLIVEASAPLRDSEVLPLVLAPLGQDPILAVLLAAVLTWLSHSSVAMVLLIMAFTQVGVIAPPLGLALVLGANLGSGLIPLALTFSEPAAARRIPLGNLLFRAIAVVLALPVLGLLAPLVAALDPDPARQIANFHSAFNLALLALFLPCCGLMARLAARIAPDSEADERPAAPRYLDPGAVGTPPVAIACATREVLRMADTVEIMLRGVIEVFRDDDAKRMAQLGKMDDELDRLHEAIKLYLAETSRNELDEDDARRCTELIAFTTNLEHVGDIIDGSLLELARKKIKHRLSFSPQGWRELETMHRQVVELLTLCLGVVVSGDLQTSRRLLAEKERLRDLELEGRASHLDRLRSGRIESIETSALHLDVLRDLKRIASHLTAVAYPILDAEGELRPSRLRSEAADAGDTESDADDAVQLGSGRFS